MKITLCSLHPPGIRSKQMSLSCSKRRTKSDSRKPIKNQNQFPVKTTGSLFLGFSSQSRLDKHQSEMVPYNWFCTSGECFSTSKTIPHFTLTKSTSCLNKVHGCQAEMLARNKALHALCWSWLECDKLVFSFFQIHFSWFCSCAAPCYLCFTLVQIRIENEPQNFKPPPSPTRNCN